LIVQAFSDVVAMEALRVRWEEIKRLQEKPALATI
jgi:hypothetical protein